MLRPADPSTRIARVVITAALLGAVVVPAVGVGPASAQSVVPVGGPPVTGVGQSGAPSASATTSSAPSVSLVPVRVGVDPGPSTTTSTVAASTTAVSPNASSPTSSTVATSSTTSGTTTTTLAPALGSASVAELRSRIASALAAAGAQHFGAYVVVDGLGVVYDQGADVGLMPASTQKLYVGATALLRLGPDRRFTTRVRAEGPVSDGVLRGDLVLEASGDPSLHLSDVRGLADDLARAGIRSVTGGLVLDDARFDTFRPIQGWKSSFVPGEVGLVNAFMIDGNRRYDLVSKGDVGIANLERFRSALAARKIKVAGKSRRGSASSGATVLADHSSAPLSDLVSTMLKKSDNTYAEVLLRQVGEGSTSTGLRTIAEQFDRFSLRAPVQVDGSGLSYVNRSTPRQMVEWLRRADDSPVGPALRAALPIACTDGTLGGRLCGTPAAGSLRAKTGTLDFAAALAGFGTTASGRAVTFAFLLNDVGSASRGRAAIDRAVGAIVSSGI